MQNGVIRQEFPIAVANHRMDLDSRPSFRVSRECLWSNVWIQFSPLPRPIIPHSVSPEEATALPAVGPVYFRIERGQNSVEVASVEGCI